MGTRCLTKFYDNHTEEEILTMYRQMDGSLSGHGEELADYLRGKEIVNGISGGDTSKQFNGMSCLAASTIAHFKKGIGSIYLYQAGTQDLGEEYVYRISGKVGNEAYISVEEGGETIFKGYASELHAYIQNGRINS